MKISVQKIKNQLPATTFSHRAGIGHDWQQTHTRHRTSRCMRVTQLQLIVSRRRQQQQQQQAKNNKPSALPTLRTCFLLHKPFTSFPLPKSCRMYFIFPSLFLFYFVRFPFHTFLRFRFSHSVRSGSTWVIHFFTLHSVSSLLCFLFLFPCFRFACLPIFATEDAFNLIYHQPAVH